MKMIIDVDDAIYQELLNRSLGFKITISHLVSLILTNTINESHLDTSEALLDEDEIEFKRHIQARFELLLKQYEIILMDRNHSLEDVRMLRIYRHLYRDIALRDENVLELYNEYYKMSETVNE